MGVLGTSLRPNSDSIWRKHENMKTPLRPQSCRATYSPGISPTAGWSAMVGALLQRTKQEPKHSVRCERLDRTHGCKTHKRLARMLSTGEGWDRSPGRDVGHKWLSSVHAHDIVHASEYLAGVACDPCGELFMLLCSAQSARALALTAYALALTRIICILFSG
jgi:hypothetical protein